MSREIKFRAWDKEERKMVSWQDVKLEKENDEWIMWKPENDGFSEWATDEIILLQYTGLKDRNGQEIFEGDALYADGNIDGEEFIGFVEWDKNDARFEVVGLHGRFEYIPNGCYVKGNMYEAGESA